MFQLFIIFITFILLRRFVLFFCLGFIMDRTSEFLLLERRALLAFDVLGEIGRSKSGWESVNKNSQLLLLTYQNAAI